MWNVLKIRWSLFNLDCANNLAGYFSSPPKMKGCKRKGSRKDQETWKRIVSTRYEVHLEGAKLKDMYQTLLMIQQDKVGRCYTTVGSVGFKLPLLYLTLNRELSSSEIQNNAAYLSQNFNCTDSLSFLCFLLGKCGWSLEPAWHRRLQSAWMYKGSQPCTHKQKVKSSTRKAFLSLRWMIPRPESKLPYWQMKFEGNLFPFVSANPQNPSSQRRICWISQKKH